MLYYFAYGSNMHPQRLRERVPSAVSLGRAKLYSNKLRWRKKGTDGSAKCDIEHTGNSGDVVEGALFKMDEADKIYLSRAEQLGDGYMAKSVRVELNSKTVEAFTYYALMIDKSLKPFGWYKKLVLRGARHHNLPEYYISSIKNVDCWKDADKSRVENALQLLN